MKNGEKEIQNVAAEFEKALQKQGKLFYRLKLFISANSPRSNKAILNLKYICQTYLDDKYELEVIDVLKERSSLKTYHIIAIPTLIKETPLPKRKLIGDLSNKEEVLYGLGIK